MRVTNRASINKIDFEQYRVELEQHRSLQDVLQWAQRQPEGTHIPGAIADLVIQDEFTHDIIVPWRGYFIVYGTT